MVRHPSAVKRHRQNLRKQSHNRWWKSRIRNATKVVMVAVEKKDRKAAAEGLKAATKQFYRARDKGVFHANAAARRVARLSKMIAAL